jgi:hypothetical protein
VAQQLIRLPLQMITAKAKNTTTTRVFIAISPTTSTSESINDCNTTETLLMNDHHLDRLRRICFTPT